MKIRNKKTGATIVASDIMECSDYFALHSNRAGIPATFYKVDGWREVRGEDKLIEQYIFEWLTSYDVKHHIMDDEWTMAVRMFQRCARYVNNRLMGMERLRCSTCGEVKTESDFQLGKGKMSSWCKECRTRIYGKKQNRE